MSPRKKSTSKKKVHRGFTDLGGAEMDDLQVGCEKKWDIARYTCIIYHKIIKIYKDYVILYVYIYIYMFVSPYMCISDIFIIYIYTYYNIYIYIIYLFKIYLYALHIPYESVLYNIHFFVVLTYFVLTAIYFCRGVSQEDQSQKLGGISTLAVYITL
jgi:hypothetical protein